MPRSKDNELTRAGWIRLQIMLKPDITLEQLQKSFDKTKFPKKERPKEKQVIYQANNQIRNRWGVEPADIPRKNDGKINMAAMVRLYIDRQGDSPESGKAIKFFAADGIELTPVAYSQARANYTKAVQASPDANQDAGPRAGAPEEPKTKRRTKKRRGGGRRKKVVEEGSPLSKYQEIEARLDKLIADAESIKARQLVDDLRNARRRAGAGILTHS